MAKKAKVSVTNESKFQKATEAELAEFNRKINKIDTVNIETGPMGFFYCDSKSPKKFNMSVEKYLVAYNEYSAKEYVNNKDGFEFELESSDDETLYFPVRLTNRPDLVKRYCDTPPPQNSDYQVPMFSVQITREDKSNKITGTKMKFLALHPYGHQLYEFFGDANNDPSYATKYNVKISSRD